MTAMKNIVYVLVLLPLGLFAQIGLGTTDPTAALEIQTEVNGRAALGLTPQSNPVGVATGQLAVIENILYLFDGDRNKWLSVEQTVLEFGRLGSGSDPAEVEYGGGDLQNGLRLPFDGTIVAVFMSATNDNNREITLVRNGLAVLNNDINIQIDGVFNLDPTALNYENNAYNFDFMAGDNIRLEIDSAVDDIDDLIVTLHVKWRKDNS